MKGSGVNTVTIDESFQSIDTTNLVFMVPMYTKRGEPGLLNQVTISDYAKVVGYDLAFNSNYLGLASLLTAVSKVQVLRINKDTAYGNAVIFSDGTFYQTEGVTDIDALEAATCLRSETFSAAAVGTYTSTPIALGESVVAGSLKIVVGGVVWASANELGVIAGEADPYPAIAGTVDASTGAVLITFASGPTFPLSFDVQYTHNADASVLVAMESPGDWDDISVRMSRFFETHETFASSGTVDVVLPDAVATSDGAYRLENISGDTLATSGVVSNGVATITGTGVTGTLTIATKTVHLVFAAGTFPAAGFPMLLTHRYIQYNPFYLFEVLRKVAVGYSYSYTVLESEKVSLTSSLDYFIDEVVFENVVARSLGSMDALTVGNVTPIDLLFGDNGDMPSSSDLDLSKIDPALFSVICTNGIQGAALISAFVSYGVQHGKVTLWDIPNFATYVQAKQYHDSVMASEMQMAYWVSDTRTVGTKKYSIFPSVKASVALANMFSKTGYLNYPIAGYDYAAVDAEELLATDAPLFPAELKLAKINYIANRSAGPVIWEQRTGYAFESDLSYGNTVFTHLALASTCKNFMDNFPFKLVTADLLILIQSGLEGALANYLQKGFIWSGEVVVPSFAEVKASGARAMDIYINVKYAEDGEEFTLNFHLKATA